MDVQEIGEESHTVPLNTGRKDFTGIGSLRSPNWKSVGIASMIATYARFFLSNSFNYAI